MKAAFLFVCSNAKNAEIDNKIREQFGWLGSNTFNCRSGVSTVIFVATEDRI